METFQEVSLEPLEMTKLSQTSSMFLQCENAFTSRFHAKFVLFCFQSEEQLSTK